MSCCTRSTVISSAMKTAPNSRSSWPGLSRPSTSYLQERRGCPRHKRVHARLRRAMRGHDGFASRRHHHLADHLAILDQPQALARLTERQHLVDHRLHLALLDQIHQAFQVLVVEAVRADDLELEAPDVAQVLLRVIAGGRAAHE